MKSEKRGKYAGQKLHLDGPETQAYLDWNLRRKKCGNEDPFVISIAIKFAKEIAKSTEALLAEFPDLLKDRSQEDVLTALHKDKEKIEKQLLAIGKGKDWKAVK